MTEIEVDKLFRQLEPINRHLDSIGYALVDVQPTGVIESIKTMDERLGAIHEDISDGMIPDTFQFDILKELSSLNNEMIVCARELSKSNESLTDGFHRLRNIEESVKYKGVAMICIVTTLLGLILWRVWLSKTWS
jgi:hypothetical protein